MDFVMLSKTVLFVHFFLNHPNGFSTLALNILSSTPEEKGVQSTKNQKSSFSSLLYKGIYRLYSLTTRSFSQLYCYCNIKVRFSALKLMRDGICLNSARVSSQLPGLLVLKGQFNSSQCQSEFRLCRGFPNTALS